jgi:hypothetical protein
MVLKNVVPIAFVVAACETFHAPPEGSVVGGPVLHDNAAPLVIKFSKPFRPETLKLQVVPYDVDNEGNLADEIDGGDPDLHAYYSHNVDPSSPDFGGTSQVGEDTLTIFPVTLPVGRKLAVLVEPGLASTEKGVTSNVRDRLLFSYEFQCKHLGTKIFTTGPYMFLIDVESPIKTQIQLFAQIRVDQATGDFVGQFTNADRNRDGSRCPGGCKPEDACQTVPAPACVAPSVKAGGVDEWVDYVPNTVLPTGYSFLVHGCSEDIGNAVAIGTDPVDLVVQQPPVTAQGLVVLSSFQRDAQGVLRATGSGTAGEILLGTKPFGPAKATVHARSLPPDQLPPGIPFPP